LGGGKGGGRERLHKTNTGGSAAKNDGKLKTTSLKAEGWLTKLPASGREKSDAVGSTDENCGNPAGSRGGSTGTRPGGGG
jgi:hypothetical protein